jgi:GAF domain-containing protein
MERDLEVAVRQAAHAVHSPLSLSETLDVIARTALISIPDVDAIGISTVDAVGNVETRAGTDAIVWELDRLQYELGEGPCVDTLKDCEVVIAPRIRDDRRWPAFVPRAVELGLKSQLAVRLYLDSEGTLGGLNIYSTHSEDVHPDAESIAELFATHAAIALGNAREIDGLNEALRTRRTIGQALGMLMNEYALDEDAAFGLLVRTSSHSNTKIRDIAARMVEDANIKAAARRESGGRGPAS